MKDKFKGYYRLDENGFSILWKNAVFIFDTNVLLNLYRYQSSTRDELLKVLERLKGRVWIPNHVGLEYQRNRLSVIAEQHKRYSEVRNIVSKSVSTMQGELESLQLKKRHSHINPDALVDAISDIKNKFISDLDELERQSINVNSDDNIRERLERLFNGNIGDAYASQENLDSLFKEGDKRYSNGIPPGFKDIGKEKDENDSFSYGGLIYKRKYGDLIVWKQIIDHAKSANIKDLILVTDDAKSDWWWKVDSGGSKTIGARPELVDEIYREARVERFYIYNTESFLNYANEQLNAKVAEKAIEEIRAVTFERKNRLNDPISIRRLVESTKNSVFEWLSSNFENLEYQIIGFPDFVAYDGGKKFGFEITAIQSYKMTLHRLNESIYRAYYLLKEKDYFEFTIIIVVLDNELIHKVFEMVERNFPEFETNLKIIIGAAEFDEESDQVCGFKPYDEISSYRDM
ncbi:PIN domain-containing protein [Aeromonas veronii]|uniref:PIN-like domain-containing protein n=1 Tax=Aeromonas veronii TaxID=654 RepID=UPI001F44EDAF|nr:PIN domain-containing protein [Aeromonas veronii]MCF5881054.1 PIN domain-containing protein [Aeromonas veronii]